MKKGIFDHGLLDGTDRGKTLRNRHHMRALFEVQGFEAMGSGLVGGWLVSQGVMASPASCLGAGRKFRSQFAVFQTEIPKSVSGRKGLLGPSIRSLKRIAAG